MSAIEREARLLGVVKEPQTPGVRVMALFAAGSQCRLVHVVMSMAADARECSVLELARYVTLLARHGGMHAKQGKSCQVMVECDLHRPPLLAVTTFASASLLPFVYIICFVAGDTCGLQRIVEGVSTVAHDARNFCVRSPQREVRLCVVIEFRMRPVFRIVASIALSAMSTVMVIVILVTGIATGF